MSFFIGSLHPDSGWVQFPNGIILQCIQVQGETGNVASAKTFPTPFPTFAIGVFGTCKNTSSAVMVQASIVDEAHQVLTTGQVIFCYRILIWGTMFGPHKTVYF
ncbi:gp53-like domain-containing protein [Yersinia ruckeri]|uniref:gp53-like domain-containing protein n=1 Tax=Yersinia ruckeri TaxID=29486 RepID=UPI00404011D2